MRKREKAKKIEKGVLCVCVCVCLWACVCVRGHSEDVRATVFFFVVVPAAVVVAAAAAIAAVLHATHTSTHTG